MSGTRPPGKTFEERWPDEVAETAGLAGPWIPLVLGGAAGLIGLPILLATAVDGSLPWSAIVLVGLIALATAGYLSTRGSQQRLVGRLWRIVTWAGLVTLLGYLVAMAGLGICGATGCRPGFGLDPSRPLAGALAFTASILGSMAIAWFVDRTGQRLVARTRASDAAGMR